MSASPIPEGAAARRAREVIKQALRSSSYIEDSNSNDEDADIVLREVAAAGLRVVDAAEHEGLRELVRGFASRRFFVSYDHADAVCENHGDSYERLTDTEPDLAALVAAVVDGPPEAPACESTYETEDYGTLTCQSEADHIGTHRADVPEAGSSAYFTWFTAEDDVVSPDPQVMVEPRGWLQHGPLPEDGEDEKR